MTFPNEFGTIVTPGDVESSIEKILKKWSPSYLRLMERHSGREMHAFPNVVSWRAANNIGERFPEQQIPACQIMVDEEVDIHTHAESTSGIFTGSIDVLIQSTDPEEARKVASLYAYSMGLLFIQKFQMETTLKCEGVGWLKLGVPGVADKGRWLGLGTIQVTMMIENIALQLYGPLEPIETEPGPYPETESSHFKLIPSEAEAEEG